MISESKSQALLKKNTKFLPPNSLADKHRHGVSGEMTREESVSMCQEGFVSVSKLTPQKVLEHQLPNQQPV